MTLAGIPSQFNCSNENDFRPRVSLRTFAILSFKKIRDMLKIQEMEENNKKEMEIQEKMRINQEEKIVKNSDRGETSFFRKFFHFDRI